MRGGEHETPERDGSTAQLILVNPVDDMVYSAVTATFSLP
jgi:hypothetical protein